MLCRIADLLVEVPAAGGMTLRCREYLSPGDNKIDIEIQEDHYRREIWTAMSEEDMCYMESGAQFYDRLLEYEGLLVHASAIEFEGKAYLFSGPSGMGKSTHTRLWQQNFGLAVQIFNDDKPALRRIDGIWYAYGTPWCGKDGINQNKKVPLAGICFLKQDEQNSIYRLAPAEAMQRVISQTRRRFSREENLDLMLQLVEKLVREIPIFELKNRPEPDAAYLSYKTLSCAAKEIGL